MSVPLTAAQVVTAPRGTRGASAGTCAVRDHLCRGRCGAQLHTGQVGSWLQQQEVKQWIGREQSTGMLEQVALQCHDMHHMAWR